MRIDIVGQNEMKALIDSFLFQLRHDSINTPIGDGVLMKASVENAEFIHFGMVQFGGESAWCCDEFVVLVSDDEKPVAVSSIAPNGEQDSGRCEIVGFYVMPEYRWNKEVNYHRLLAEAVVSRCRDRGLTPVFHMAISRLAAEGFESLSKDLRELVNLDRSFIDANIEPTPGSMGELYDYDRPTA
jgi:hypothetical protein